MTEHILNSLFKNLKKRKNFETHKSYTAKLLSNPNLLAKKIGEELKKTMDKEKDAKKDYDKINGKDTS